MKQTFLLFIILSLFGCSDNNTDDMFIPEIPETLLKVKTKKNRYITTYFYNDLGYIDSLAQISNYGGNPDNFYQKFIYNQENIIEILHYKRQAHDESTPIIKDYKEIFEYTNGLISKKHTYDSNENLLSSQSYTYEDNNNIIYSSSTAHNTIFKSTYKNKNLIETVSTRNDSLISQSTYTYDNRYHPMYYIFPEVFLKINSISKNNIKETKYLSNSYNQNTVYELQYNNNHFLTSSSIKSDEQLVGATPDYYTYY